MYHTYGEDSVLELLPDPAYDPASKLKKIMKNLFLPSETFTKTNIPTAALPTCEIKKKNYHYLRM